MNRCINISRPKYSNLDKEVKDYLIDAGFQEYMFRIEKYIDREYIRVYMSEKSVDFILKDINKSDWKYSLEIKKYKKENISAIFTFR